MTGISVHIGVSFGKTRGGGWGNLDSWLQKLHETHGAFSLANADREIYRENHLLFFHLKRHVVRGLALLLMRRISPIVFL